MLSVFIWSGSGAAKRVLTQFTDAEKWQNVSKSEVSDKVLGQCMDPTLKKHNTEQVW